MREEINRVAEGLAAWRNREERFEKIFPGTLQKNRPFLIEKLDYWDNLQGAYGRSANETERITLHILKAERNRLAKIVYPNFLLRFFRKLFIPLRQKRIEKQVVIRSTSNIAAIEKSLKDNGFGQYTNQVQLEMKKDQPQFSIPVSYYVNEKDRMDFTLAFAKDDIGAYQFTGFQGCLTSGQNQVEQRQHRFQFENGTIPTAEQAYNLLAGRAVCVNAQGNADKRLWKQFDLNNKDTSGDYRVKNFLSDYGYDLRSMIQQLPLQGNMPELAVEQLIRSLEQGRQQEIIVTKNDVSQKYFINANPQFRNLQLFDEQGKKVTLAALNKPDNAKQGQPKIIRLDPAKGKRKGLSK